MTPVRLSQLAGQLLGNDLEISGYSTDTRTLKTGDIYFCLRGDNFDGHHFAQKAIDAGASAIICEEQLPFSVPQVVVSDSRQAFGVLAGLWRKQFAGPVIGVTGSNGKTTVKQLLASIFQQAGAVHFTRANDNNEIGVPQTLLGLSAEHQYAVVEMGASHLGEIKYLGSIVKPDVSVITNASAAHLEGFGSADAVADEKAWIYRSLPENGTAVINADDAFCDYWKNLCKGKKIITFGEYGDIKAEQLAGNALRIHHDGNSADAGYALTGAHNVANAAAAAACAIAAGLTLDTIARGLAQATPVKGRLNFNTLANNITLIDDTYNANPASTRAAVDVLCNLDGKRVMVLGDLLELGDEEIEQHQAIGVYAHANGVDHLLACGERSKHTVDAFGNGAQWFENQSALLAALASIATDNTAVLVKGSRSMQMEAVVAGFTKQLEPESAGVCCS